MLTVWLLGKLALQVDGRALKLRDRNKGLALIAYLAVEGSSSRDKLSDLLWSDLPQSDARRNLRQRLYELKNQLPEGWLSTQGDTVELAKPLVTDLESFQALIAAGNDEAGLQLWRGRPLADLELSGAQGFEEWLDALRETWTERYCASLRRAATSRETCGDLRGALEAHERLLQIDELQEFHQRETMRLLECLGERENALHRYERFRQTLCTELGTPPLPQTAQLAERIRQSLHDPRSAAGSAIEKADVSAALNLHAPLTGRETEWRQLEGAQAGLMLIVGVPGIGKTRLAEELAAHTAQTTRATWCVLRGREGSSGSPLYPVAEALRLALQADTNWLERLEPVWRSECARLVPELDPSAAPQPMPSIEGRVRFLEGLARALCASVGDGGAILLDDLHWFDSITLELIAHLARRAAASKLRLIATARAEELGSNETATPILTDLKRDGLLNRHDLEPLEERDVRSMIQSLSGGLDAPNFAHRLHDATAGNPFYLLETLRELHGGGALQIMPDGAWTTPFDSLTSSYSELPIPATVRETVLQRVTRAGPATRRLLEAASLAGNGFTFATVSSAVALSEWEGLEGLERAVSTQLIEPSLQVSGGYSFNHDLTRRALDDALNPDRRRLIHQKLAVTLENMNGSSAQIAEHFERGDWKERAAKWRVKAGEEAARVYAYEQALEHYQKALEDGMEAHETFNVYASRAEIWKMLDRKDFWELDAFKMKSIAESCGDLVLQSKSILEIAEAKYRSCDYEESLKYAREVLEDKILSPDDLIRAKLISSGSLDEILGSQKALEDILDSQEFLTGASMKRKVSYYLTLAELNYQIGNLHTAKKNNAIAHEICMKDNNNLGIAQVLAIDGLIHEKLGKNAESRAFFLKSSEILYQINNVTLNLEVTVCLARISVKLDLYDDAKKVIESCKNLDSNKVNSRLQTEINQITESITLYFDTHLNGRGGLKIF